MTDTLAIRSIWTVEPKREGEYPVSYSIGDRFERRKDLLISDIKRREVYLGDRAEVFYDVFAGEALLCSISVRDLGGMNYVLPPEPTP